MPSDRSVVIVDAVRTPIGRRGGGLSSVHPAELLGIVQQAIVERTGIDPAAVGQVVGGCVSQVGEQSFNVTRTAWLAAGLPLSTAATTIDTQCGSSQQATNLASSLVGAGVVDVAAGVRRRGDEPHPDRHQLVEEARPRRADPEDLLRPLRDDLAVRGRRAHRREVGHQPRGHRRLRAGIAGAGRPGVGRGPLRRPVGRRRGTRRRRGGQADRVGTHTVERDEGIRETLAGEAGDAEAGRP